MTQDPSRWMPLDTAAAWFGYTHRESLRRRLRQLRRRGLVQDTGRPPATYRHLQQNAAAPVVLMWPNPQTALLRSDAPRSLLHPSRGRRAA